MNKTIDFSVIDGLIKDAIQQKIFPSASVMVANSKKIIFGKCYGTFTYENEQKVHEDSMYDIASLTKVVATLPAIMKLYGEKKIDLMDPVVKYIPEFHNNNKEEILLLHLLLHNSGLRPKHIYYSHLSSKEDIMKEIFKFSIDNKIGTETEYSCIGFILLCEIFHRVTGKSIDSFCSEEIFKPLGMSNTLYNPSESIRHLIVPTEMNNKWRKGLIQGVVHDEKSALLGGVSGNAGLFSTAQDLVKYMQMTLNNGTYTDTQGNTQTLFAQETIKLFTKCYEGLPYENTRALGWETKPITMNRGPPCGTLFSKNCFGHTGFTGTSMWADREKDLIIILLTNRVYPSRDHSQEAMLNFRPIFHDKITELFKISTLDIEKK